MNILTLIEDLYKAWDGTPEDACKILRAINLSMRRSEQEVDSIVRDITTFKDRL